MDGDLDSGGRYPAPRCSDDFRIELSEASDACAILVNQTSSPFPQISRQNRCDCLGWNPIIVSEKCSLQQGDYFDIHEDIQWCFAKVLAQGPATPTLFPTIATIIPTKPPLTTQETTNATIRHPIVYVMETTNHPAMSPDPTHIVIVCSLGVVILLCALLGLLYMITLRLTENNDMAMIGNRNKSKIVNEYVDKNPTIAWDGERSPERRASVQVQKNTDQFLPPVQPSLAKKNSTSDTIGNNEGSATDSRRTKRRKKKAKHKHKGQHHQRPNDGHPPPRTNGGPRKNGGYQLRINGIHSDNMVRNSRKKELRRTRTKHDTKSSPSQTPSPSKELRLARGHSDPTVRHTSRKERSKARARSSKNDTKESSDGSSTNKKVEKNRTVAVTFHRMDSSSDLSTSLSVSHADLQTKPSKKKPGHLTQTKRRRKAKKRKGDSMATTPSAKANKLGAEAPDMGKLGARKTSRRVKKKRKRPKKSSERTLRPSRSPEPTTPSVRDEVALKALELQYENIVLQKELQDLKEATKTEESSGQGTFFQRKSTLTQLKEAVARMEKAKSIAAAEKHSVNIVNPLVKESSAIHPLTVVVGRDSPTLEHLKSKKLELYE